MSTKLTWEGREQLGRVVRAAWVQAYRANGGTRPDYLAPWEVLDETNKEIDRCIGEAVYYHALVTLRG